MPLNSQDENTLIRSLRLLLRHQGKVDPGPNVTVDELIKLAHDPKPVKPESATDAPT